LQHIKSLDGIRALAVILVVISHSGFGAIVPGGFGVTVFFFLSGFLITTLLQREYEKTNTINYRYFLVRRALRIFIPLYIIYFLLLILAALDLYPATYTIDGVLSQVFFYSNYFRIFCSKSDLLDGTGQLWSLAVEEHFYIIFPLLYLTLTRFKKTYFFSFCITTCLIVLVWRIYLSEYTSSFDRFYFATDTRFDSILYGVLLSLLMYKYNLFGTIDKTISVRGWLVLLSSVLLLLATFIIRDDYFRRTIRYSLQGIALLPLFYYAVTRPSLIYFKWLNFPWLTQIGLYSYVIYLIHNPIIHLLESYGMQYGAKMLLLVLLFSYLFAAIFYRLVERPVSRYKHHFSSEKI